MMQLLAVFQKQGYTITVASAASNFEFSADLNSRDIQTQVIELNNASFDAFVSDFQPSVVLFDRFLSEEQFGWRVVEQVPNALRILDTEDLHSLRHVRELCFKKEIPFTTKAWLEDDKTKREIASMYRCDLSLIISSFELDLLTDVIKMDKSLLLLLPFMIDEIAEDIKWTTFENRTDFMFIGGGKHTPNIDAINYLKTAIWPLIHAQLPKAKLNIYGAYLPQQILEMHNPKEGFLVQGRVDDVNEVMQAAKVCLAPLHFGAGIKGKLVSAMQNGTPSVTTTIGAEGMQGILEWNGYVENDHAAYAQAAVRLYTIKLTWENAQEQGKTLINTLYSKKSLEHIITKKIEELQKNLSTHRQQNFIGALLQYQTFQSTKFMGKWIEEKNRR
ncbi:glycosyltransferase [Maribacter sp. ACAM166]|uniref:glycosyltransferase n=1 Tax=Maribacter sp. ACAM166 TaxID=2508996 RepID=UPI0010FD67B5|nr:glycosyltransferase family 4 protein [Maribacter sp. ACAM166]TLP79212.1 glycosyltransferase family 4 protein [Maribacter sp. ACAM166]